MKTYRQSEPINPVGDRTDVMETPNVAQVGSLSFGKIWEWRNDGYYKSRDGKGEEFTVYPRQRKDNRDRNQMFASGDSGGPILKILGNGKYELLGIISRGTVMWRK